MVVAGSVAVHKAVPEWLLGCWLTLPIPPAEVVVDGETGETVETGETDIADPV